MNLEDLSEHIGMIQDDLRSKKLRLPRLLFTDPALAMEVRYQIECLEPRLRELERSCRRMTKERDAALSA